MNDAFFHPLDELDSYQKLKSSIGLGPVSAFGLSEGQKAHIAAALCRDTGRQVLMITHNDVQSARLYEDLVQMMEDVVLLPAREISFHRLTAASRDQSSRRLLALSRALSKKARVIVCSIEALQHRVSPPLLFERAMIKIKLGDRHDPQVLVRSLVASGYERMEIVEGPGQCALRGGILDIFPPDLLQGVRIEFFDDEIDSLRAFDVMTQRSQDILRELTLIPAREALPQLEDSVAAAGALLSELSEHLKRQGKTLREKEEIVGKIEEMPSFMDLSIVDATQDLDDTQDKLTRYIKSCAHHLSQGEHFEGMEMFLPYLFPQADSALSYFDSPILLLDEPDRLRERTDNLALEFSEQYKTALERGEALPMQANLLFEYDQLLLHFHRHPILTMSTLTLPTRDVTPLALVKFEGRAAPQYHGQMKAASADVRSWQQQGYRVILLAGGVSRGGRLAASLLEENLLAPFVDELPPMKAGEAYILPGTLAHGFIYPEIKLVVISDGDLFGVVKQKSRVRKKSGEKIAAFTDLSVGDYVVHESHGVGVYQGTIRLSVEGTFRDYLHINYQGGDKLYVPTDQLDRVQKFIGVRDTPPRIHKLGGGDWQRQKQRVKASIRELAVDLVKLYASRREHTGFSFSADTPWQREFEDNFPYEETDDQLQSIQEIKEDMQSPITMDRLLCGDVGYGKTEVALRAAFKAVMDGKQVAILAPTTILAQQHYQTIHKRFEGFPVRADVLSRFKTPKEQKQVLANVKAGELDILVGTHRLLGKDVAFRDLGLLVVDEEQRFGVQHKEQLKELKKNVDVLTLSATPIPRTLHMSMVGIRDMSLLETPPEERYPVQTYVVEYTEGLVRDAILRELGRGGQVYLLYNRVESIDGFYEKLRQIVPEARIAIGHGQMREHALEDVMMDFNEGKFDVLLCTTIIESGLDIPLANTLIIYDADYFGLSQLYQLRGRVGRSNRLAYCYLTIRQDKVLSETAQKRLTAIREFTDFGSGFKIALRDLEIRGAGNILGPEQHGHMSIVGYDLYCKLMEEALKEMRGEITAQEVETRMELRVDAFLPEDYVRGDTLRIEVYQRIAGIADEDTRADVIEELIDRFGNPPPPVMNLVDIANLKALCSALQIEHVFYRQGALTMRFHPKAEIDLPALLSALKQGENTLTLAATKPPALLLKAPGAEMDTILHQARDLMRDFLSTYRAQIAQKAPKS